jgi:hypothetical protein
VLSSRVSAQAGLRLHKFRILVISILIGCAGVFLFVQNLFTSSLIPRAAADSSVVQPTTATIESVALDNGSTADRTATVTGYAAGAIFTGNVSGCGVTGHQTASYQYTGPLRLIISGSVPTSIRLFSPTGGVGFYNGCTASAGVREYEGSFSITFDVVGLADGTYTPNLTFTTFNGGSGPHSTVVLNPTIVVRHASRCTITVQGVLNDRVNTATGAQFQIFGPVSLSGTDNGGAVFEVPPDSVYQLLILSDELSVGGYASVPEGSDSALCTSANNQHIQLKVRYKTKPILEVH